MRTNVESAITWRVEAAESLPSVMVCECGRDRKRMGAGTVRAQSGPQHQRGMPDKDDADHRVGAKGEAMTYSERVEPEKQNKRMEIRLPESELAAVERAAGKNKSEWAREAFRLRLCGPLTTGTTAETPFPPDHNMGVGRVPGAGNGIMGGSIGREAEATKRVNALQIVNDDRTRFYSKVDKDGPLPAEVPELGPCWVWTGTLNRRGYGMFSVKRTTTLEAHLWAYRDAKGAVPDGLEIDHLCRNPACCRPAHLEAVTRSVNVQRGVDARAAAKAKETQSNANRADAEAKPERITKPSEPQMSRSAQRMAAATGGRAPHLPKCTCAVCVPSKPEAARKPRPKTGKGKKA